MYSMSYESLFNVMASTNKSIFRSTGSGKIQYVQINKKGLQIVLQSHYSTLKDITVNVYVRLRKQF